MTDTASAQGLNVDDPGIDMLPQRMGEKSTDPNTVTLEHPFKGEAGQQITHLKLRAATIGDVEQAQQISEHQLTQDLSLLALLTTNAVSDKDLRSLHPADYNSAREHLAAFLA